MPTIGQTLKESREKRKISIDVAAKAVKIKTEVLEQIEKDDFSVFAAPLYARGIIRLYAGFLGLEPETLVEEYNKLSLATKSRSQDLADDKDKQTFARRSSGVMSTVPKPSDLSARGVAGLVGIVVFLGVAIWVLSSNSKSKVENSPSPEPATVEPQKRIEAGAVMVPPRALGHEMPPLEANTNAAPETTNAVMSVPATAVENP